MKTPDLSKLTRELAAALPVDDVSLDAVATEILRNYAEIDHGGNIDMNDVSRRISQRLMALAAAIEETGEAWDNARMDHQVYLRSVGGAGGDPAPSRGSTLPPALGGHAKRYAERERGESRSQIDAQLASSYLKNGLPLARIGQGEHTIDVRG